MATINVGFIGFGIMGQCYAEALGAWAHTAVAAVADVDGAKCKLAAAQYECPVYESYHAMLDEASLDAVIIAVPDFLHKDPFVATAAAGKHILVEKPLATNVADAEAMVRAVEKAGVTCQIEFANRWSLPFVQARERVRAGELGDVLSVTATLNDTVFVPTEMLSWAGRSTSGWFLMSHTADLATWITGKQPSRVFASGTTQLLVGLGIDTYDLIEALVEYSDGTTGRYTSGWVLPTGFPIVYELKMRLIGTEAAIDIDMSDQGMHFIGHDTYEHVTNVTGKVGGRCVGFTYDMLHGFVDCVRNGKEPRATVYDGLANVRFLAAMHESLETGQPVAVST